MELHASPAYLPYIPPTHRSVPNGHELPTKIGCSIPDSQINTWQPEWTTCGASRGFGFAQRAKICYKNLKPLPLPSHHPPPAGSQSKARGPESLALSSVNLLSTSNKLTTNSLGQNYQLWGPLQLLSAWRSDILFAALASPYQWNGKGRPQLLSAWRSDILFAALASSYQWNGKGRPEKLRPFGRAEKLRHSVSLYSLPMLSCLMWFRTDILFSHNFMVLLKHWQANKLIHPKSALDPIKNSLKMRNQNLFVYISEICLKHLLNLWELISFF